MWRYKIISLILLILFGALLPAQSVNAMYTWGTQTLTSNGAGLGQIAIDSAGNLHTLYGEFENGDYRSSTDLIYSTWTGSSWDHQFVTKDVFSTRFLS